MRRTPLSDVDEGYHYHDFYEIIVYFSEEGTDEEVKLGSTAINGHTYSLRSGDVVLIKMFDAQRTQMDPSVNYIRYSLSINPSVIIFSDDDHISLYQYFSHTNKYYPVVHLPVAEREFLRRKIRQYEQDRQLFSGQEHCLEYSILFLVIAMVQKVYLQNTDGSQTGPNPMDQVKYERAARLIHYIDENLDEDLSLKKLAGELHYSVSYISRIFREVSGTSLNQYITTKRISVAKLLLADSSLTLDEISRKVGFNSYNHFFRCFRKEEGVSPSEYRRSRGKSPGT